MRHNIRCDPACVAQIANVSRCIDAARQSSLIKKSRHGTSKGKGKGKGKSTANRGKKTIDKVQEVSDDQLKKIVTTIITEDSPYI